MTPNKRGGIEHLPPDEFRIAADEIKCAAEYERESQASKSSTQKSTGASSLKSEEQKVKGGAGL